MAWKGNRTRRHQRLITFNDEELRWVDDSRKVENRMRAAAGLPTVGWMAWARRRIMTEQAVEVRAPADLGEVVAQLSRIGNNINQIAHAVNIRQRADHDDLIQVQRQLERIDGMITDMRDALSAEEDFPWHM